MKRIVMVFLLSGLMGCTDASTARRALDGAGYTEIRLTGYRFVGCSESDNFATGFEASGPTGKRVAGMVCSGLFKGATIRMD
jgi:hypothetical protein